MASCGFAQEVRKLAPGSQPAGMPLSTAADNVDVYAAQTHLTADTRADGTLRRPRNPARPQN